MTSNRVWVVLVAAGPAFAIAGVFANRLDALQCVDAFQYRQGNGPFAYAQEFIVGERLPALMSMARRGGIETTAAAS